MDARIAHAAGTPALLDGQPLTTPALLGLQRTAGNAAVGEIVRRDGPVVQRWQPLGDEAYNSQPMTADGTGDIAGVPEPGQGRVETRSMPILEGTEAEWRDAISQGGDGPAIAVYGFLRAAMLDDIQWQDHVRAYYDGIPPQSQLMREVGTRWHTAQRRVQRPSETAQLALAKAIYVRGRAAIGFQFDQFPGLSVLMEAFLLRMQPRLIEDLAQNGTRFGPEFLGPATHATTGSQQTGMIGSAAGTIARATAKFAAWDQVKRQSPAGSEAATEAEREKMIAIREAETAGQVLRGVGDTAATIRREEIERNKSLIGIALAAVPMSSVASILLRPYLAQAPAALRATLQAVAAKSLEVVGSDRLSTGLAEALARDDHTQRIEDIRTEAVWEVRQFRLGDPEADFVNTINGTLEGAGH